MGVTLLKKVIKLFQQCGEAEIHQIHDNRDNKGSNGYNNSTTLQFSPGGP